MNHRLEISKKHFCSFHCHFIKNYDFSICLYWFYFIWASKLSFCLGTLLSFGVYDLETVLL